MNERSLTKLSAIAEIVSSVAILITLIYLAIQTNQNTKAIHSSSRQEILNAELWMLEQVIEDPTLELIAPLNLFPEMERNQAIKQANLYNAFFRIRENLWFQYQNGVIDESTWQSYRRTLSFFLSQGGNMRVHWENLSQNGALNSSFIDEIESEFTD